MSQVRRARTYLARVAEPPAPALSAFIDAHGPVEAARRVQAQQVPEPVARETAARHGLDLVDADIAAAAEIGARLIIPEDEEEWPTHLITALARAATTGASWAIPPVALWVQSAVPLRDALANAVSVIGARDATSYGETAAADIGYRLATDGVTVLSGLAYGIDGAAHRGALAADGLTAAVVATGIDQCYPAGHQSLLDRIRARGVVVTEYPPGAPPARHRFLARNRLVAALSRGTVVVEATARSGSLSTAHRARVLDRRVMAVPGPITSAQSTGCHQLIRDHAAELVTSVADIHHSLDTTRPRPA
ncbi:DNA protecting protein DprA [Actinophytocola xanthii]|uniref:DNA protecting protein DprA n=2 Tax=Actinophytocola xanthii TaxID=1912961 RepID=A0A1Q8C2H0_9PSEU|nr:DNA protecting protein DprA [Actinophytocola xanthii]